MCGEGERLRLCIVYIYCNEFVSTQTFMICDTGGGTVVCSVPFRDFQCLASHRIRLQDLAVYKIIGSLNNLENAEVCARSASNCGSLFLDLRFRELVHTLLAAHPVHLDAASLAYFMHTFSDR
jgi:hypothetical protein